VTASARPVPPGRFVAPVRTDGDYRVAKKCHYIPPSGFVTPVRTDGDYRVAKKCRYILNTSALSADSHQKAITPPGSLSHNPPADAIFPVGLSSLGFKAIEGFKVGEPLQFGLHDWITKIYPSQPLLRLSKQFPGIGRYKSPSISVCFTDPQCSSKSHVAREIFDFLGTVFHSPEPRGRSSPGAKMSPVKTMAHDDRPRSTRLVVSVVALSTVVICQAICTFYPNKDGILVEWLGVSGKSFLKSVYGKHGDGLPFRKRGLSSFLLATVQHIGKSLFSLRKPILYAEVKKSDGKDDAALDFYRGRNFKQVDDFPLFIKGDPNVHLFSKEAPNDYRKMKLCSSIVVKKD
jgi:hypothetical protein